MKKLKHYFVSYPEYYLVAATLLAFYKPPFTINAFGIILAVIFFLQATLKIRLTGILIGCLFFLFNIYLILALVDEFNEFPTVSTRAIQMLLMGTAIITINLTFSVLTVKKYLPSSAHSFSQ